MYGKLTGIFTFLILKINIFKLSINYYKKCTYQHIFKFDVTMNQTLTVEKSNSLHYINCYNNPSKNDEINWIFIMKETARYFTKITWESQIDIES